MEAVLLGTALGGLMIHDSYKKKKNESFTIDPVGHKYGVLKKPHNGVQYMTKEKPKVYPKEHCPYDKKLLDLNNRSINDFKNNYFIPNINRHTQNMTGTGVDECSYLGFNCRRKYDFGNANESANLPILDRLNYTDDATYRRHKEVGPLFSPEEQQDRWITQTPLMRPDLDRFKQDLRFKPDEKPCEPIRVGPGIGLGVDDAADGGFNAGLKNRVLPTNKFNYESNQLQGYINIGKHHATEMPQSLPGHVQINNTEKYGVPQKKPDTFWTQKDRPMVPSGAQHLQSVTAYSAQGGPLKVGLKRKDNLYGFGKIE